WTHVAVTLSGSTARLYLNGVQRGSGTVTLQPSDLGSTTANYLGKSQWPDPPLDGAIDDFRIYSRALSAGEISAMATTTAPAAPASLGAVAVGDQVDLTWSAVAGATSYTVYRAETSGGSYQPVGSTPLLSFQDVELAGGPSGADYFYVVTADNAGGEGPYSPEASATILPPLPTAPTNLSAHQVAAGVIQLAWDPASDAASYMVQRAATSGGPYTTVAAVLTGTGFVDTAPQPGMFYYVVLANNAAGDSGPSGEAAVFASEIALWLKFDETTGTAAADSSGFGLDGNLIGGPTWDAGELNNAVRLDGVDDYVALPSGVLNGLTDITISAWVYLDTVNTWERIFDFGAGTEVNMFLTPQSFGGGDDLRFAIKNGGDEQQINPTTTTTVPLNTWTHVAVTLGGGIGVLYLNGAEVGRNNALTISPADLGVTTQNYIGKSQYPDPYLDGRVDDFRIYNRVLSAAEVSAVAGPPDLVGDYNHDNKVDAADYPVWRDALGARVLPYTGADGNGDGFVDHQDYKVWIENYGNTGGPIFGP
ncbi:MAG: hypothetical protein KDA37_01810, partial [Planctomycetales bacterium]|nr:hypothetical protein [Planctomycetales bacterium]